MHDGALLRDAVLVSLELKVRDADRNTTENETADDISPPPPPPQPPPPPPPQGVPSSRKANNAT